MVGLGSIGRRHARNWHHLGLGDVWVYRATDTPLPEPLGVPARTFRDLDEALSLRPNVVIVANPTSLHLETALRAARAGCHVLVEKPLGADLAGVDDLLAESAAHGVVLAVGYNLRFHPLLQRTRDLLDVGAIGRPLYARADVGEYLPGWHPWEDYRQGYSARRDLGGGPVLTLSHDLDALCWVLGEAPASIACVAVRASGLEVQTEDIADITLRFPSGAVGSVHVDYVRRPPRRYLEVVGEDGVLRWEYEENRLLVYAPAARQWRVEQGSAAYERNAMFLAEARALAASVAAGAAQAPLADGAQGAAVLALALIALRASDERREIPLTPDEIGASARWLSSLASRGQ